MRVKTTEDITINNFSRLFNARPYGVALVRNQKLWTAFWEPGIYKPGALTLMLDSSFAATL